MKIHGWGLSLLLVPCSPAVCSEEMSLSELSLCFEEQESPKTPPAKEVRGLRKLQRSAEKQKRVKSAEKRQATRLEFGGLSSSSEDEKENAEPIAIGEALCISEDARLTECISELNEIGENFSRLHNYLGRPRKARECALCDRLEAVKRAIVAKTSHITDKQADVILESIPAVINRYYSFLKKRTPCKNQKFCPKTKRLRARVRTESSWTDPTKRKLILGDETYESCTEIEPERSPEKIRLLCEVTTHNIKRAQSAERVMAAATEIVHALNRDLITGFVDEFHLLGDENGGLHLCLVAPEKTPNEISVICKNSDTGVLAANVWLLSKRKFSTLFPLNTTVEQVRTLMFHSAEKVVKTGNKILCKINDQNWPPNFYIEVFVNSKVVKPYPLYHVIVRDEVESSIISVPGIGEFAIEDIDNICKGCPKELIPHDTPEMTVYDIASKITDGVMPGGIYIIYRK